MIAPREYFLGLSIDNPQGAQRFGFTADSKIKRGFVIVVRNAGQGMVRQDEALCVHIRLSEHFMAYPKILVSWQHWMA